MSDRANIVMHTWPISDGIAMRLIVESALPLPPAVYLAIGEVVTAGDQLAAQLSSEVAVDV